MSSAHSPVRSGFTGVVLLSGLALGLAATVAATPALADVQKVLFVCVKGKAREICPQLRAAFKTPDGWVEDKIAASRQGKVVWVPKGKTFDTAPFAITALTVANKAKVPLDTVAQRDQEILKQKFGELTVAPLQAINNPRLGGPVKVVRLTVPARKARPFEMSARFEDKDADGTPYVVELTLLSPTEKGLAEAKAKFDGMIKAY